MLRMKRIAITGGIGSGKSSACEYLQELGYSVVSADKISKQITEEGEVVESILKIFGKEVEASEGKIDRRKLRERVFDSKEEMKLLQDLTFAEIMKRLSRFLLDCEKRGEKFAFAEIPLLFEHKLQKDFDETWLITANKDIRLHRIMTRDSVTMLSAQKIMDAQMPEDKKIALSDYVIYNDGDITDLYNQILVHVKRLLDE